MTLTNRILFLLSVILLSSNLNAQSVEQFFIKITPNQDLVNCGKLINKKTKTILEFYVENEKLDIIEPSQALAWINDSIQTSHAKDSKVVFFIHGYWGSLPFALNRTTQEFKKSYFNSDTTHVKAVIHILWDANDLYYKQSIKMLEQSSKTLASIFNSIASNLDFRYSLMCHSMGNRFLHKTLSSQEIKVYFEELILMAPDLDYKKYEEEHALFSSLANSTTVFYHLKDKTLKMSKGLNKVERLGRLDKSSVTENIQFVDCTSLKDIDSFSDSVMRHLYFLTSNTVKKQVQNLLDN